MVIPINIAVGVMVANRLYDLNVPVIELSLSQMAQIDNYRNVQVAEDGSVTMTL